jgi:mRNA interferase MazF
MDCEPGDVMVVPFPFSERPGTKRRPALALSSGDFNREAGHTVLAMITTSSDPPWPGDVIIEAFDEAGLPRRCIVRLKLFTLDNRLLLRRAGHLGRKDRKRVDDGLRRHVPGLVHSK